MADLTLVEKQLKKRIARGETGAIVELYDRYGESLLRYLTGRVGATDARDVLQNVFTRLFRYHKKLARAENLAAYIFLTARNESIRFQKSLARQNAKTQPLDQAQTVVDPASSASSLEDKETVAILLAQLDETSREVVQLKIFSGLTFKEVAKIIGVPEQTAASKYRRAIEKLRQSQNKKVKAPDNLNGHVSDQSGIGTGNKSAINHGN